MRLMIDPHIFVVYLKPTVRKNIRKQTTLSNKFCHIENSSYT